MKVEEEITLYKLFEKNKINKIELDEDLEKAGCILIVSDLDIEEKEIFLLYNLRFRLLWAMFSRNEPLKHDSWHLTVAHI